MSQSRLIQLKVGRVQLQRVTHISHKGDILMIRLQVTGTLRRHKVTDIHRLNQVMDTRPCNGRNNNPQPAGLDWGPGYWVEHWGGFCLVMYSRVGSIMAVVGVVVVVGVTVVVVVVVVGVAEVVVVVVVAVGVGKKFVGLLLF